MQSLLPFPKPPLNNKYILNTSPDSSYFEEIHRKFKLVQIYVYSITGHHWIGLRGNLQETPISYHGGKHPMVSGKNVPFNQSNDYNNHWQRSSNNHEQWFNIHYDLMIHMSISNYHWIDAREKLPGFCNLFLKSPSTNPMCLGPVNSGHVIVVASGSLDAFVA